MRRYVCIDLEMSQLSRKNRRMLQGLKGEIIQVGAVMLDQNFTVLDTFSSFVRPSLSHITPVIQELTGIRQDMVENAEDLVTVFDKYLCWLGDQEVTTFCWGEMDYTQLWNEFAVKARHRIDFQENLKTFVDLQETFMKTLGARLPVSLKSAVRLSLGRFEGRQHQASDDALNTALVLKKLCCSKFLNPQFEFLHAQPLELLSWRKNGGRDGDFAGCTNSFASFMSPELLARFNLSPRQEVQEQEPALPPVVEHPGLRGMDSLIVRLFPSTKKRWLWYKYEVGLKDYVKFLVALGMGSPMTRTA